MLAKKFRLPSSVKLVGSLSAKVPEFTIRYVQHNLSHGRFGFVVAKSVDKRAVVRNKLKRLIRSVIEEKWLTKGKGRDFLFIIKPALKTLQRDIARQKVDEAMKKILS